MSTTNLPEAPVAGLSAAQVAERVSAGRTNEYRERTSRSAAQILRANVFTIFNGILGVALVLVLALGTGRTRCSDSSCCSTPPPAPWRRSAPSAPWTVWPSWRLPER